MAQCIKKVRKKTQVCVGSLRYPIEIFQRALTPPVDPTTGQFTYTETFTLIASVNAMIETPEGETVFDEIGIERIISTIFNIRFIQDITSENWIVYENERYDIIKIINYQKNNLFLSLMCTLAGDEAKEASKA